MPVFCQFFARKKLLFKPSRMAAKFLSERDLHAILLKIEIAFFRIFDEFRKFFFAQFGKILR